MKRCAGLNDRGEKQARFTATQCILPAKAVNHSNRRSNSPLNIPRARRPLAPGRPGLADPARLGVGQVGYMDACGGARLGQSGARLVEQLGQLVQVADLKVRRNALERRHHGAGRASGRHPRLGIFYD